MKKNYIDLTTKISLRQKIILTVNVKKCHVKSVKLIKFK